MFLLAGASALPRSHELFEAVASRNTTITWSLPRALEAPRQDEPPLPAVQRTYAVQDAAMVTLTKAAQNASATATPDLLSLLDSERFRLPLRLCCSVSGVADWPAEKLLESLRQHVAAAEIVHNVCAAGSLTVAGSVYISEIAQSYPSTVSSLRFALIVTV